MAAQQGIRLGSSRGTALRNIIRLIPAVVVIAATLNTVSCTGNHTLFPQSNGGGGGSKSPTATPTTGTGSLAFVTNFNDGMVSSFTRNPTSGALTLTNPQVKAGANHGPRGVVASPNGNFLYVANMKDDNIYEFSVNQTTGALTKLATPSISNGSGSGPDELAINLAGTFLWVTGANKGTVTTYAINSKTGQLKQVSSKVTGLGSPFGIAVNSAGTIVYVADHGAGLVDSFSVGSDGVLTKTGSVPNLGLPGGTPGFIAIDPAGTFIYVTDLNAGVLSIIQTNPLAASPTVPSNTTGNVPIGIGYATLSSGNFIYTANQGNSSLWSFLVTAPGNVSQPVEFGNGNLNAPTGLVVDPQNAFLYTTNQNAVGTVSQFSLSPTCSTAPGPPCFVSNVATEHPANTSSGPFGITLAR